jgi:Protein of unknown function with HXXEE motif
MRERQETKIKFWGNGCGLTMMREHMVMDFMRKNWYYIGGVLFIILAMVLAYLWNDITTLQRLLMMSFMALLVHQFEEYGWPGGFPAVMNIAWQPSGDKPDSYPLNRQSALFVNVIIAYPFYILAIIFPNLIWLGLATMFFGMAQLAVHGIIINKKMHSIYNPGLFAVVFLHWPIGVYYILYVVMNGFVLWWMWPVAVVIDAAVAFFGVNMPVTHWFADRNSPYQFSEEEMSRFNVREKMERLNANKA